MGVAVTAVGDVVATGLIVDSVFSDGDGDCFCSQRFSAVSRFSLVRFLTSLYPLWVSTDRLIDA